MHRDAIRRAVERHGVANPRIFGSAARGEDTEQSDLDLLVDKGKATTYLDLENLETSLVALLGVKVDVVTSAALHRRIRRQVLGEAVPL